MSNTNSIPKRSEISSEYKWKLEDIYSSDSLWEEDFKKVKEMAGKLSGLKGKLSKSSEELLECLELDASMNRLFEKVYVYANMRSHEDTTNSHYQSFASRADSLGVEVSGADSFVVPEILDISDETIKAFMEGNEGLRLYKKYIDDINRKKPHVLSAAEERLLAMSGELMNAPESIYSMINNADMKFPSIKDENGNEVEVTKGRYISFMESSDRRVRKDAFEALYSTYKKQINTIASTLSANVKANLFRAKARKYNTARESFLFEDNVSTDVYDNLIKSIHDNMHIMHRYVSLRKKMLGLDELHMYDLYTPIVKEFTMEVPYNKAVDIVQEGLTTLGEEYISDLKKGMSSGWIDVYENEGKRSGAYSWGSYDTHPYVLLNYNNNIDNAFTLAHEMGHAMHSFYSDKNQPYIYAQYRIFVAEVASTTNESLLMHHMLKNTKDKKEKMYLLNHYMESFRGTVYRQTMFAEFEKIIHERAEAGEALTAELLSSIYHDLNVQYYGPDMVVDDYIDLEWARIPHFYSSFYVYKYATGFSAATAFSQQMLKEGKPAVDRYLSFLRSGGSDYPLNLLKNAGVDMTTPDPVNNGLKVFEGLLDEFEQLI